MIFAVLIATLAFLSFGSVSAAQQHYVNPGESIQGAIDNATAGDTIVVRDGTYTENINVYKRLTIQSETGAESTIVHAANNHIFNITADHVNITGFTIEDASFNFGILITGVNDCNISNNIVSGNYQGIYMSKSNRNTIFNNNAFSNENNDIYLKDSNDNRIVDNNASNNVNCNGISINSANNNEIRNNIANSNHYHGIGLLTSSDNEIYLNNFMNNANNAYSNESTNVWNSQSKITYFYNGNTYTNYTGNYWDDYTGTDRNGDGLGDSHYSIDSDKDDYPLMVPWQNYVTALFRT